MKSLKKHCLELAILQLEFSDIRSKNQWGTFYPLIAIYFATQNIGGAKELVVLL